jgi:hypothetical protein
MVFSGQWQRCGGIDVVTLHFCIHCVHLQAHHSRLVALSELHHNRQRSVQHIPRCPRVCMQILVQGRPNSRDHLASAT